VLKFYLILTILIALALVLLGVFIRALIKFAIALQGPFFAPVSYQRIKQIIKLAGLKPGMKVADLGSGDGRILIKLVKTQPKIKAIGYEIDPKYVKLSRKKIKKEGLENKIIIKNTSFWKADLSSFDVITIYCTQNFMKKLEKKLKAEIGRSTKVISVYFHFPTWKVKKILGDIKLYMLPDHKM
jgi:tRNA A58 N-methylase Trm61